LRHNLREARRRGGDAKVAAIVKADAYGHGAARVLPALAEADMLGVACIEEALALREAGADKPVLLMEGVFEADELPTCARLDFHIAVHEPGQVAMLEVARLDRPLTVWLDVDTGMNRLGFRTAEAIDAYARLRDCGSVAEIRLMTHFASAEEPQDPATRHQIGRFAEAAQRLGLARSFCNSAGVLGWPEAHAEWIRPGVMLYGISPLPGRTGPEEGLLPVMTLSTALIAVREVQAGEAVGYGAAWRATMPSRIGIAALGYADGYPRHAPSGTPVLVNGRPSVTVGRVSMDMLAVDLGDQPEAGVGDPVTLWGEGLPAERVAASAGTIAYELVCGLAGRVHVELRDDP
jgi:alanine racemase